MSLIISVISLCLFILKDQWYNYGTESFLVSWKQMQSNPDLLILNATIRRRYQKHRDEYNKTMPAPNGNSGGHGFVDWY